MRVLNDKEQAEFFLHGETAPRQLVYRTAKAQHKLDIEGFIEWGEEPCVEVLHTVPCGQDFCYRKDCPDCWQSLKQLVEE